LPDLTKLLELTGPKALGLFLACLALRLANAYDYVALADIHASAAAVNDVVMFIAGGLTAMWIVEALTNWIRRKRHAARLRRKAEANRAAEAEDVLSNLQTLTREQLGFIYSILSGPVRRFDVEVYSVANDLIPKRVLVIVGSGGRNGVICELHPALLAEQDRLLPALKAMLESGDPNVVLSRRDG
jgi:hypothetical protein